MSAPSCPTCAAKRTLCCGFDGGGANLKPLPTDLYLTLLMLAFTGRRNGVSGARISERNIVVIVVVVVAFGDGGEIFWWGLFGDGWIFEPQLVGWYCASTRTV